MPTTGTFTRNPTHRQRHRRRQHVGLALVQILYLCAAFFSSGEKKKTVQVCMILVLYCIPRKFRRGRIKSVVAVVRLYCM